MKNQTQVSTNLSNSYESDGYENRELSQREIAKMLTEHGIRFVEHDECITAIETYGDTSEDTFNTANWSLFDMLAFLGY